MCSLRIWASKRRAGLYRDGKTLVPSTRGRKAIRRVAAIALLGAHGFFAAQASVGVALPPRRLADSPLAARWPACLASGAASVSASSPLRRRCSSTALNAGCRQWSHPACGGSSGQPSHAATWFWPHGSDGGARGAVFVAAAADVSWVRPPSVLLPSGRVSFEDLNGRIWLRQRITSRLSHLKRCNSETTVVGLTASTCGLSSATMRRCSRTHASRWRADWLVHFCC